MKGLARICVALVSAIGLVAPGQALDFGNVLQRLDVDKVIATGQQLSAATQAMPVNEEIGLGRELAARILGSVPPLADPGVQSYVNQVGRWLTLHTERPDLPWHFVVAATDHVGAFATPGGSVIVTAGLMRLMRDENELAGVLAHEISHVVQRHHVVAIMNRARARLAADVATELASQIVAKNPLVTQALLGAGMSLYGSGLDQGDEYAADRAGMVIAARAGYDPTGLVYLLTTLDSLGVGDARMQLLSATHPPTRSRIDALAPVADQLNTYAGSLQDGGRFAQIQEILFR
ncbi:MAG: M48 family metalloprotease [Gammaproteobacteria bacterium]|nr:M48 family metalloprotease [Gammaproteobacteria bacterium]